MVDEILADGAASARRIAGETMGEVRDRMGFLPPSRVPSVDLSGPRASLARSGRRLPRLTDTHGKNHQGRGRAGRLGPPHQGRRRLPRADQREAGGADQAAAHAGPDPGHRDEADQQRRGPRADRAAARLRLLLGNAGGGALPGQRAPPALLLHDRDAGHSVHRPHPRVAAPAGDPRPGRGVRAGPGAGDRRERQRQELHRRGDGPPHQPHPAQARRHHREPDRVSPPGPELLHHPARGRGGHREPGSGAPRRACGRTPTSWSWARWPTRRRSTPRSRPRRRGIW